MRNLYNHYIPNDMIFSPIPEEERHKHQNHQKGEKSGGIFDFFRKGKTEKNAGLSGILKQFNLEDIDAGDILLFLILIFLVIEGDNWEMAIILGLVLFLSLRSDGDDSV